MDGKPGPEVTAWVRIRQCLQFDLVVSVASHCRARRRHHDHPRFRWLGVQQTGWAACESWVSDDNLTRHLDFALRRRNTQAQHDRLDGVDSFQHPDARIIRPRWAGEVFDLHACVQARSPSNSPRTRSKISKRHSQVSGRHSARDNTSVTRTTPLAGRTTPLTTPDWQIEPRRNTSEAGTWITRPTRGLRCMVPSAPLGPIPLGFAVH